MSKMDCEKCSAKNFKHLSVQGASDFRGFTARTVVSRAAAVLSQDRLPKFHIVSFWALDRRR